VDTFLWHGVWLSTGTTLALLCTWWSSWSLFICGCRACSSYQLCHMFQMWLSCSCDTAHPVLQFYSAVDTVWVTTAYSTPFQLIVHRQLENRHLKYSKNHSLTQ